MALEIITTSDGSDSLLNTSLNETYHSVHGAIQESEHVFIMAGLDFLVKRSASKNINILEVGFGTGLNALLTLQYALGLKNKIHYTTLEAFPLEEAVWSNLNYGDKTGLKDDYNRLHLLPWEQVCSPRSTFNFLKLKTTLQQVLLLQNHYDLIYFDAFAPSKQPEMWAITMLQKITASMASEGVLVTYCAKGQLKRDLKTVGLQVETLCGPPGKKEMVRAMKPLLTR